MPAGSLGGEDPLEDGMAAVHGVTKSQTRLKQLSTTGNTLKIRGTQIWG